MLAYNLNCWLMLFHREEGVKMEEMKHTTLATARLRFLFLAAGSGSITGKWGSAITISIRRKDCFSA